MKFYSIKNKTPKHWQKVLVRIDEEGEKFATATFFTKLNPDDKKGNGFYLVYPYIEIYENIYYGSSNIEALYKNVYWAPLEFEGEIDE